MKKHLITLTTMALLTGSFAETQAAVLILNPATDTYVRGGANNPGPQNTNFVTSAELLLGSVAAGDSARPILTFSLTDPLLTGATINSVSLSFVTSRNDTGSTTNPIGFSVHELTQSYTASQTTWAIASTGTPWSTYTGTPLFLGGGGVFNPTALSSISVTPNGIGNGTTVTFGNTLSFASLVGSNLGGNINLLIKQDAESAIRNLLGFHSMESSTSAFFPVLTIDFTPVPEPSTILMMLGGIGLLILIQQQRIRRSVS